MTQWASFTGFLHHFQLYSAFLRNRIRRIQQTCLWLVKENLETHEKNLEILQKNSEILFFSPDQTPLLRELDTNLIPRAYFLFKMADRRGEKR